MMKRIRYNLGIFLCCTTFLFSGFMVCKHYLKEKKQTDNFSRLAGVVEQAEKNGEVANTPLPNEANVLPDYAKLYRQNRDMVGWISIEGTKVNYPVMQTPEHPNYYLKRNFDKEYSDYGVPYVAEDCDLSLPCDNVILYGHHMKDGSMFAALENYKDKDFFKRHNAIRFDTLAEKAEYRVIAVFKTVAYSDKGFRYYLFTHAADENAFHAYVEKCKELSLYDTGATAEYGDKLITLSTCEYSQDNGRLVVVAKKMGASP